MLSPVCGILSRHIPLHFCGSRHLPQGGNNSFYNPENNASTFFPAAGRRLDRGGYLEYVGETGYYWSSSTGPNTATAQGSIVKSVWSVEIAGWNPGHLHILPTFGYSIRCVKDEMSSN